MEYLPFSSVEVPCFVPLITILAKGKGSLLNFGAKELLKCYSKVICLLWISCQCVIELLID